MTATHGQLQQTLEQVPLSYSQELWCWGDAGDEQGTFDHRFTIVDAWDVTGPVDLGALQGALDDVVRRHEMLRTVVARDADPPHQLVHPPGAVPLEIRDVVPDKGVSRDQCRQELVIRAGQSAIDPRGVPGLRATLARFSDRDSVLVLVTHHTGSDEWSMQLIMRDLAACYAARTAGRTPDLPPARQYREFVAWQRSSVEGPHGQAALEYWRAKLDGASVFALPTDRPVPDVPTRPYSTHNFIVGADVMSGVTALAQATGGPVPAVLLAAVNVLAWQIRGTTDPVIDTFVPSRGEPSFHDSVGPFLGFLALRTAMDGCISFSDVVAKTADAWLEAGAHEIPIQCVEEMLPGLMQPYDEPRNSRTIFGVVEPWNGDVASGLGETARLIRSQAVTELAGSQIPHGLAWSMEVLRSGPLHGCVRYNLDEFDEQTLTAWTAAYSRILGAGAADPSRNWTSL
jgi:condensation enzyme